MHIAVNVHVIFSAVAAAKSSIDPSLPLILISVKQTTEHRVLSVVPSESPHCDTSWKLCSLQHVLVLPRRLPPQNNTLRRCVYQVPHPPCLLLLVCGSCSLARP